MAGDNLALKRRSDRPGKQKRLCRACLRAREARRPKPARAPRTSCRTGHDWSLTPPAFRRHYGCLECHRARGRESWRRRHTKLLISYGRATQYGRKILRKLGVFNEDDVDDLVAEAYLHYLDGWIRNGERRMSPFARDILDAWRSFTGSRNKRKRPRIATNVSPEWFASRTA
jgi:hypothetical protein